MAPRVALGIYNAVLVALAPLLWLKKATKFRARGHHHEIDRARWQAPPELGELAALRVVFVALSWGEVAVLEQITRRLEADFAGIEVVWAIRSSEDAARVRAAFPARTVTTMPFDFAIPVRRWLQAVRPDVLLVVEKFWWPNLVWGARGFGARVVLLNGRSRGAQKGRYRIFPAYQRWILGAFDALLFESEAQIERVRAVLPRGARVVATGNVKFAFAAPEPPPSAPSLEFWLENGAPSALPILVAGSTSPADETWVFEAFGVVRNSFACRLLLAPRRIERAGEVAARARDLGFAASLRRAPQAGAEVLILDTLGELSYAYRFCVAAYVGGAVEGRGHNIIEPLAWGKPVAYGPHRGDFESVQRAAETMEVGAQLQNPQDLADFWQRALHDETWLQGIETRAAELISQNSAALDTVVELLGAEIELGSKTNRKDARAQRNSGK